MKIVFINIPWMKYYVGEGDEEKTVPLCGYNFQNVNGYYYGYGEGLEQIAIENIEGGKPEDAVAEDVLVVWTAKNRESENKIIGWYKKARVYKELKSFLTLDSDRIDFNYTITAKAENCTLLPTELRAFDIKETVESVCFEKDEKLIKDVAMYIHNYGGEKFNFLLEKKDLTAESILNFAEYEMYFAKADEFLAKDLYGKALRCFNKAISIAPDLTLGYECKGSILLSLKMYDEALEVYKRLLELDEAHEEACYCMGLLYGLREDYRGCIAYLDSYITKNKKDAQAIAERGIAYYNLGDSERAKADFGRAYQMESDNPVFHKLITYVSRS
ncbi:MAG: tetratricopeptide repeat protein [Clostridia bacterium]|jgi:tetratricopeptide (TPR) repeat protein|nr:tetratricopeptide repeat protein [Clostridia bacterium]